MHASWPWPGSQMPLQESSALQHYHSFLIIPTVPAKLPCLSGSLDTVHFQHLRPSGFYFSVSFTLALPEFPRQHGFKHVGTHENRVLEKHTVKAILLFTKGAVRQRHCYYLFFSVSKK